MHSDKFIAGTNTFTHEAASKALARLYDGMVADGYPQGDLQTYLARILFCLFADASGVFAPRQFAAWVGEQRARGASLGGALEALFAHLYFGRGAAFPVVGGALFGETLAVATWSHASQARLDDCLAIDWAGISPIVFGDLFQTVLEPTARREHGCHYTNERDIYRVLDGLFLDDLKAELKAARGSRGRLRAFHRKLCAFKVLDPACGSGNFLVVIYKELRRLEHQVLKELYGGQQVFDILSLSRVRVSQMRGIEITAFAASIAQVALWMMDHQLNVELAEDFGLYPHKRPLTAAPGIYHADALTFDWETALKPAECSHIVGNPPFVGKTNKTQAQRDHCVRLGVGHPKFSLLDFAACWFAKAATYLEGTEATACFVCTSGIVEGEQAGILWPPFLRRGIRIRSGHRQFLWESSARNAAHVVVIIVEFGYGGRPRVLVSYDAHGNELSRDVPRNISPYLTDAPNHTLRRLAAPLGGLPVRIETGCRAEDGGYYTFTEEERAAFVAAEPQAARLFRPFVTAKDMIHDTPRWYLSLSGTPDAELLAMPEVAARMRRVSAFRSAKPRLRKIAFGEGLKGFLNDVDTREPYFAIAGTFGEDRDYLTPRFYDDDTIACDATILCRPPDMLAFGVISSSLFMLWIANVGGRMGFSYRFSTTLAYNNFPPYPKSPTTAACVSAVRDLAKGVVDARAAAGGSLRALYRRGRMPEPLTAAHRRLDAAVLALYGVGEAATGPERLAYLLRMNRRAIRLQSKRGS